MAAPIDETVSVDKQPTEVMPVVKPTMNGLILKRMDGMEESFLIGLQLSQEIAVIHKDHATIKMQNWMNMILAGCCLAVGIVIIVIFSFLFGRVMP